MGIQIIDKTISKEQLVEIGKEYYPDLVKGVVDIELQIVALGGEMNADAEEVLLKNGSCQSDLWGFNILLDKAREECFIYESFINIRPRDNNKNIEVKDPEVREKMRSIIFKRVNL